MIKFNELDDLVKYLEDPGHYPTLFKFVKVKEHAEQFMNGELYMRSPRYFTDYDSESIGDKYEGKYMYKSDKAKDGDFVTIESKYFNSPIFCMYSVDTRGLVPVSKNEDKITYKFNFSDNDKEEMRKHFCKEGYKYAIVVREFPEFFKLLEKNAINFRHIDYESISEIDDTLKDANFNPVYRKVKESYSIQREYRCLIKDKAIEQNKPYICKIGSIRNFTQILDLEDFLNYDFVIDVNVIKESE
ncbi:MAG: hypothetical protein ACK5L6_01100 [Anaerorhabdus sp.]|uniref:hypothetical protein n=1 Tax=Anaerorhabdus sp. TaxID=1872524 RepID=UPI003A863291